MAINFTDSPSDGDTITADGRTYTYNSSAAKWKITASSNGTGSPMAISDTAPGSPSSGDLWFDTTELVPYIYYADGSSNQWVEFYPASGSSGGGGVTVYANIAALPSSSNTGGDLAFVTDVKAVYVWDGTEWDRVSSGPNETVGFTTSPAASYNLSAEGSATTVTIAATDPEGFPVTYGHVTNPSNQAQATISQSGGTFTITPSTNGSNAGDFSLKFTATDGVHVTSATSAVSLKFWEYVNWTTFNNYYNNYTGWQFNDNGTDIEVWNNANLGTASATHTTYTIADGVSGQVKVYWEFTNNASQQYYGAGFISTTKTNSDNHLRDVTTVGSYPGHYGGAFSTTQVTNSFILDRNTKKLHYWNNGVYDTTRSRVMANGTYYAAVGDGASANARTSATKSIIRGINSNGTATFTYNADTLWQSINRSSIASLGGSASYGSSGSPVGSYHLIMQDADGGARKITAGPAQDTLSSLSTFTICCWVKQTSSNTIAHIAEGAKLQAGNSFGDNGIYCAANGNWDFHPRKYNGSSDPSTYYAPVTIGTVAYDNWLHLVISCNVSAGSVQMWASKDSFGDIKNDSSAATSIPVNALDFATWYLGGSDGNAEDGNSRSQIDDLKIFSSNLTSTQAESVYNSTASSAGYVTNLDHHFKFENNLDGTYTGA